MMKLQRLPMPRKLSGSKALWNISKLKEVWALWIPKTWCELNSATNWLCDISQSSPISDPPFPLL